MRHPPSCSDAGPCQAFSVGNRVPRSSADQCKVARADRADALQMECRCNRGGRHRRISSQVGIASWQKETVRTAAVSDLSALATLEEEPRRKASHSPPSRIDRAFSREIALRDALLGGRDLGRARPERVPVPHPESTRGSKRSPRCVRGAIATPLRGDRLTAGNRCGMLLSSDRPGVAYLVPAEWPAITGWRARLAAASSSWS